MFKLAELSDIELDTLREVGNIGAGHAATSLSKMLGKTIEMSVPKVEILRIPELSKVFNNEIIAGVLTAIQELDKSISGFIYVILSPESTRKLVTHLCGSETMDEIGVSAITETGNILSCSFCNALSELFGVAMLPSPPSFAIDFVTAVIDAVMAEFAEKSEYVILFRTELRGDDDIVLDLLLIPNTKLLEKLMDLLRGL